MPVSTVCWAKIWSEQPLSRLTDFSRCERTPHAHVQIPDVKNSLFVGESYQYSVSDLWKVFFNDFDSSKTALFVLDRAKTRGLQNILSSVYNLYMFFVMLKHLHPRSSQFWDALEATLLLAKDYNLQEYL